MSGWFLCCSLSFLPVTGLPAPLGHCTPVMNNVYVGFFFSKAFGKLKAFLHCCYGIKSRVWTHPPSVALSSITVHMGFYPSHDPAPHSTCLRGSAAPIESSQRPWVTSGAAAEFTPVPILSFNVAGLLLTLSFRQFVTWFKTCRTAGSPVLGGFSHTTEKWKRSP